MNQSWIFGLSCRNLWIWIIYRNPWLQNCIYSKSKMSLLLHHHIIVLWKLIYPFWSMIYMKYSIHTKSEGEIERERGVRVGGEREEISPSDLNVLVEQCIRLCHFGYKTLKARRKARKCSRKWKFKMHTELSIPFKWDCMCVWERERTTLDIGNIRI